MRIRKTLAVILAVAIASSFTMTAFASIGGYGSGTTSGGGGSGSGGGGGAAAYTPSAPTAETPQPVTSTTVSNAVTAAISAAVSAAAQQPTTSSGSNGNVTATIKLTNVSTVAAAVIQNAIRQATARNEVTTAVVTVDAVENGVVLSRVYINPTIAAALTGTVNLAVFTNNQTVASNISTFTKFFNNNIASVSLGQKGGFGANVPIAVKIDLSKLSTQSLVFYAYDRATGRYAKLNATYKVDAKGYLHFATPVGGEIIISDKPLARK